MKRLLFLLLALCMTFSACSSFVPSEYVRISEHDADDTVAENADTLTASDFESLKDAIRSFVKGHIEHGVICVRRYEGGSVEEDLATAAYQIAREDPYGAYMVDYMTHSCSLIVSYYEISIDITFREGVVSPERLSFVAADSAARMLVQQAMEQCASRLVLYVRGPLSLDLEEEAVRYYEENPGRLMAMPETRCVAYPEEGTPCIVEMTFQYPESASTLREMAQAVEDTLLAASVYVRYRDTEREKAELLFTYLMERFAYVECETQTPVYSHLCDGLTTSKSAAQSWQLLCDEIGLECVTVSGLYRGAEHWWNIVCLDGEYSHVDTCLDLLEGGVLYTRSDAEMFDYYWDAAEYPACIHPEPEPEEPSDEDEEETSAPPGDIPDESGGEAPDSEPPTTDEPPAEPPSAEQDAPEGEISSPHAR